MADPKIATSVERNNSGDHTHSNHSQDEKHIFQSTSTDLEGREHNDEQPKGMVDTSTAGVRKVEAFNHVLYRSGRTGKLLLLTLVVSIGLTMFGYALDQGITSQFTVFAASFFGQHAQIGAVNTASQIIRAVSKPFIGKMADITSRPTTYVIVLVFYAVGFAVAASCTTIAAYIVGIAFTAFGKSGLDLLSDIIVGDLTTLQWRGFFGSLLSAPFLITTFINAEIAESLIPDQWRWGLGLFAILMPALLLPAIFTLYAMQFKAKKQGMVSMGASGLARKGLLDKDAPSFAKLALQGVIDIDLLGLILLGFAFSLILLPFNLYSAADNGWSNPSMIAMLVVGFVVLALFILWEIYGAEKPAIPKRIMKNRAFLAAVGVNVTSQMASSDRFVYFSSYMYIIKPWSNFSWNIFLQTTTLALCVFGPICGLINAKTHRYKTLMVFGASMKLIGYGLCLNGGRATQSTAALATSQVMLGMGSFTVVGARVGSQASVPHEDLATLIASLSLWSTLASSVGSTIATSIWQEKMLPAMREEAPLDTTDTALRKIYGSIRDLRTDYDWNDPLRRSAIAAYTRTEGTIFVVGTVISALSIVFCLLMPNYYLGKQQNAVTNTGLDGKPVDVPLQQVQEERSNGLWSRIKRAYYKEN